MKRQHRILCLGIVTLLAAGSIVSVATAMDGAADALPAVPPVERPTYKVGDNVQYNFMGTWFDVTIIRLDGSKYVVHCEGRYKTQIDTWDEAATIDQIRAVPVFAPAPVQAGASTSSPATPSPLLTPQAKPAALPSIRSPTRMSRRRAIFAWAARCTS